jgi:hypothetical protein
MTRVDRGSEEELEANTFNEVCHHTFFYFEFPFYCHADSTVAALVKISERLKLRSILYGTVQSI